MIHRNSFGAAKIRILIQYLSTFSLFACRVARRVEKIAELCGVLHLDKYGCNGEEYENWAILMDS
ncbi:hypothetical protein FM107_06025 [Sphingobacterium sp. JB170]|nr:hypothetical protein FM107_06025 [Sphingobacterium sp. JB170]